jgi:hypothetical protein
MKELSGQIDALVSQIEKQMPACSLFVLRFIKKPGFIEERQRHGHEEKGILPTGTCIGQPPRF